MNCYFRPEACLKPTQTSMMDFFSKGFYLLSISASYPSQLFFRFFITPQNEPFVTKNTTFPSCIKSADKTHLHKKEVKIKSENYRLVSILPTLSKCFEKCMFSQTSAYFHEILILFQKGVQYSTISFSLTKESKKLQQTKLLRTLLTNLLTSYCKTKCVKSGEQE